MARGRARCREPVCTLAEYAARCPLLLRVPSEAARLFGEMLSRSFSVSTEECTRLILSLAIALRDFHESGFCVSGGFGESNLVVSGHTFQDVDFEPSTSDGIESNYRDARAFIVNTMFQVQEAEIPDDIKHLLHLMASPGAASMGSLRHARLTGALGEPAHVLHGVLRSRPVRKILPRLDPAAEATVLEQIPYLDDWAERAEKSQLLELSLNRHQRKYMAAPAPASSLTSTGTLCSRG